MIGPLDTGPYADTVVNTRKTDVEKESDKQPGFCDVLIIVLLFFPVLWVVAFIALYCWAHIGPIVYASVIGLLFWACARYGTNRSVLARFRYRTTRHQRVTIARRLSDVRKKSNVS